ncbi:putative LRR receptor-like serine/threonine-protein kinase [Gossypium australe]|uniref:Putative LRR receptor-like serine/threonine-protein kinase n=1 Tax=Gossypium australe TaxID=47621 RepID=A0A5B6X014_9ROSI|nr:putative LRR receptor-like serine/threonine-protein kinase [Gossypium australe]
MCKRFIEGLNEDIKLLVGILDINEFVVLVERAYKAEELMFKGTSLSVDSVEHDMWENAGAKCEAKNMMAKGRPPRNVENVSGSQRGTTDTAVRSKARAPTRAYTIPA